MVNFETVVKKFYDEYINNTPKKLKLIDAYLFYIVLTGVIQFMYCCLVGTFPFNSFLAGFISTVSCFVLAGKCSRNATNQYKSIFEAKQNLISYELFFFVFSIQFACVCK